MILTEKEIKTFAPLGIQHWRMWLRKNHNKRQSVWLVFYKKNSTTTSLSYSDAVDEALCFGWIDSKAKPIDEEKFMRFFCKRKATGTWSKVNKEKIDRLVKERRMTKAGFNAIETARQNGSWKILDEVEKLIIPKDLAKEFTKKKKAEIYFLSLCRSDKRNILQWLVLARLPETREKRIIEIADLANQKLKPVQFRG